MKVIGDRVSILKKDDLLSIVILPIKDQRKVWLMFVWLMAWTVCGIIVFANYFKVTDQNTKLFIIIYLAFWVYFEFKIARVFVWRRSGKEKLWISEGKVHYQQEVNKRGKIQEFDFSLIQDLQLIEAEETSFITVINSSFWIKGGERIAFTCQHKTVRFGMQLTDKEAKSIIHEITNFIFTEK
ncbi:MAG: hypothetical protein IPJ60_01090 [Sphingobacteriaceae bacterium]|nr:hypothetical protein [Sphingobacteriaceae bacterium]